MPALPLRQLEGKYEILEKLREGGMGAIYKVRHRLLDEIRVIKVMRPQFVEDEELKARFLREARLAIRLRHPNVAQLYDFTVDDVDGTAFIVMEFIDGMTLEDILKSIGPPPLGLALEAAQQSLKALGYLHTKGFIHRDISPDNLMLTEDTDGDPLIKLIDLGIAKILGGGEGGQHTATGMYLGKVRYSSPEQFGFEGALPMDARGDLYSFGIVLYELLTGKYPILGRDSSSLIAGHLFRPPLDFTESDPEGRVPAGLRAVVLTALAKSPDERPQSAQEFSRALAAFRVPSDLSRRDLKRALSRHSGGTGKVPAVSETTQGRLDEQFGLVPTPPPQMLTPVPAPKPEREAEEEAERQRAREMATAIAEIQSALARGDYRSAETQLFAAEANYGQQEVFPALYERVAELRRRDLDGKVAAHVANARRQAAAGDWDGARAEIKRAQRLDAESADLAAATAEVEAAERQAAEKRRQAEEERQKAEQARQRAEEEQRRAEEQRRREEAERQRLAEERRQAEEAERQRLAAERQRLEEERRRAEEERRAEAARLMMTARSLTVQRDFPAALEMLGRAGELDPGNAEVASLLAETQEAEAAWAEKQRRAEQAAKAAAKIAGKLDRGDLDGAQAQLDKAVAAHGEGEAFKAVSDRLAELRRVEQSKREAEEKRAEQLAATVAEISAALAAGRLEAAGGLLDRAVAAFGGVETLRQQWEQLETLRREKQERQREADLAAAAAAAAQQQRAKVEALVSEAAILSRIENFASASRKLRQALDLDPADSRAQSLLAEAESAQRRAERPAPAAPAKAAPSKPTAAAKPTTPVKAPAKEPTVSSDATLLLPPTPVKLPAKPPAAEKPAAAAPPPAPRPRPQPAIETQPLPIAAAEPPPPALSTAAPAPRRQLWIGLAAGIAVVLVALGLFLWSRGRSQPASTPPETPPAPVTAPLSVLIVDAVPWGEVTEVVDAQGRRQPLPAKSYTPLVLSLPPGSYTVTLRNPNFPRPVSLSAAVAAGAPTRSVAEFGHFEADDLFRGLGW